MKSIQQLCMKGTKEEKTKETGYVTNEMRFDSLDSVRLGVRMSMKEKPESEVIDEELREWKAPSLCVYNPFLKGTSDENVERIDTFQRYFFCTVER